MGAIVLVFGFAPEEQHGYSFKYIYRYRSVGATCSQAVQTWRSYGAQLSL